MKYKKGAVSLVMAAGLVYSGSALAIANIESEKPGLPDDGLKGNFSVSMDGESGNANELNYDVGLKLNYRNDKNMALLIANKSYGETEGVEDDGDSFVHLRGIRLISDKWAAETFVQWAKDEFTNLKYRALLGGGGRYTALSKADTYSLSLGLGAFREKEVLDLITLEETTLIWRLNSFLSYNHQISEQTHVVTTAYFQPSIDDSDDYRILWNLGLSVQMTDSLSLGLEYQLTHDSLPAQNLDIDPAIDNDETNSKYATSISYQF